MALAPQDVFDFLGVHFLTTDLLGIVPSTLNPLYNTQTRLTGLPVRTAESYGQGWWFGGSFLGRQSVLAVPDRSCLG